MTTSSMGPGTVAGDNSLLTQGPNSPPNTDSRIFATADDLLLTLALTESNLGGKVRVLYGQRKYLHGGFILFFVCITHLSYLSM